jgi:hypothetical protein
MGLQEQQYMWLMAATTVTNQALMKITEPESPMAIMRDSYNNHDLSNIARETNLTIQNVSHHLPMQIKGHCHVLYRMNMCTKKTKRKFTTYRPIIERKMFHVIRH